MCWSRATERRCSRSVPGAAATIGGANDVDVVADGVHTMFTDAKAGAGEELLVVDIDRGLIAENRNRRPFLRDRRPELYRVLSEK